MAHQFVRCTRCLALLVGLLAAVSLAGCQNGDAPEPSRTASVEHASDGHEEHASSEPAAPESFAAEVAELKEHYTDIKAAFAETDSEKAIQMAHEPLHGIGHILEALPGLAAKTELSTENVKAVKEAVDTMFECYGNIDGAVHDKKTPDYNAEAEKLDEAMAAIEAVSGQPEQ